MGEASSCLSSSLLVLFPDVGIREKGEEALDTEREAEGVST